MLELVGVMPLAQLNASTGGAATGAAPAPVAPTPEAAAPAATAASAGPAATGTASTTAPGAPPTTQNAQKPGFFDQFGAFIPMIVILGALYFFLTRGQRK